MGITEDDTVHGFTLGFFLAIILMIIGESCSK